MITPIETEHNGMLFRSRLEARWAVFFDTVGIPYEYEQYGFSLPPIEGDGPDIKYLPDFYLPKSDVFAEEMWVEVKGPRTEKELERDRDKLERLVYHNRSKAALVGEIPWTQAEFNGWEMVDTVRAFGGFDEEPDAEPKLVAAWDDGYKFCVCTLCGKYGFEYEGRAERIPCGCAIGGTYTTWTYLLSEAYLTARKERFGT